MVNLSYYRNRFKGELNKNTGFANGQLKEMFPSLQWNEDGQKWEIDRIGDWYDRSDGVYLDDEWWEAAQMDNNTNEDSGWYYIENSFRKWDSSAVRPAKYEADWYTYALNEMKKPRDQRFKTPYAGEYIENNQNNGKILAEVFAEDLIPLAVQHAAGVLDLFWRETHDGTPLPPEPSEPASPDLTPIIDKHFEFLQTEIDPKKNGYKYEIFVKIDNIGKADSEGGSICFDPGLLSFCRGRVDLGTITPDDDEYYVTLFFNEKSPLKPDKNGYFGHLKISGVSGEENEDNNNLALSEIDDEAGGIDLTSTELSGIKIDPNTNQIKFVIKGIEAKEGENVIDLNGARNELTKIFFIDTHYFTLLN